MNIPVKGEKSLALMQRSLLGKKDEFKEEKSASDPTNDNTQISMGSFTGASVSHHHNSNNPVQGQHEPARSPPLPLNANLTATSSATATAAATETTATDANASHATSTTVVRSKGKDFAQMQNLSPDKILQMQSSQMPPREQQLQPQQQLQQTQSQSPPNNPHAPAAPIQNSNMGMKSKGKDFASMISRAPPSVHANIDLSRQNAARKAAGLPPLVFDSTAAMTTTATPTPIPTPATTTASTTASTTIVTMNSSKIINGSAPISTAFPSTSSSTSLPSVSNQIPTTTSKITIPNLNSQSMVEKGHTLLHGTVGGVGGGSSSLGNAVVKSSVLSSSSSSSIQKPPLQSQLQLQLQSQLQPKAQLIQSSSSQSQMQPHLQGQLQDPNLQTSFTSQPNQWQSKLQSIAGVTSKPKSRTPKPTKAEGCMTLSSPSNQSMNNPSFIRQQSAIRVKLSNILKSLDPSGLFSLESDAEELLVSLANDFSNSLIKNSVKVAKHRNSFDDMNGNQGIQNSHKKQKCVHVDDVAFVLQKNYGMSIPGLPSSKASKKRGLLSTMSKSGDGVSLSATARVLGSASSTGSSNSYNTPSNNNDAKNDDVGHGVNDTHIAQVSSAHITKSGNKNEED